MVGALKDQIEGIKRQIEGLKKPVQELHEHAAPHPEARA
jgi:hypothetical protein